MRVLITGASGFIGSRLARRFIASDDVHVFVRESSNLWRLADIKDKLTLHCVDLTDRAGVQSATARIQPELIYHCANEGLYGGVSKESSRLFAVNVQGFLNLLEALRPLTYRACINTGTSSEYGPKNEPMSEADLCEPVNIYGVTKLSATLLAALEAHTFNKPVATFRLFSPYGPYDDASRLITRSILGCIRSTPFTLPHSAAVRDYTFVEDIVDALVVAPESIDSIRGEVLNIATGTQSAALDVVHLIAHQLGAEDFLRTLEQRQDVGPYESPRWQADMTKTKKLFPNYATLSLSVGLARTVEWFTKNQTLYEHER